MRVPLAATLESRDGTVTKDAKVLNGVVETRGESSSVRKRPGLSDIGLMRAGVAQALCYWNGSVAAIADDYLVLTSDQDAVTWNPADKGANVTLSNGNLTTANTNGSVHGVRATSPITSGKRYWEIVIGSNYRSQLGMGNSSALLVPGGGYGFVYDNNGVSLNFNGYLQKNSVVITADSGSNFSYTTGDVIGIAYDADARTIGFNKNGGAFCYITGSKVPTGDLYPMVSGTGNTGADNTARFSSGFGYSAPTGYTAGLVPSGDFYIGSSTSISPTTADLQFSMQDNGSNAPGGSLLMFKNREQAWYANTTPTVTQVTDVDYPGKYAVTLTALTRSSTTATATTPTDTNFQVGGSVVIAGVNEAGWNGTYTITGVTPSTATVGDDIPITITRSGTTATATCTSTPHGFATGATVTISGADQAEYNGAKSITVTSTTAFTFTVTVSGADYVTPATGTIAYTPATSTPSAMSVSTEVATFSTYTPHGLETGHTVSVFLFYRTSSGYQNLSYPGVSVTKISGTQFTVPVAGAPDGSATQGESAYCFYTCATVSVTSITSDGVTATLTASATHYLTSGISVYLYGAGQSYYNGSHVITSTGATTFTYAIAPGVSSPVTPATGTIVANGGGSATGASFTFTVDGTETTPATGTITATSGRNTVPGIAYMDSYFVVMDVNGVVYNSAPDNPGSWNALEYITAQAETGAGKFLGRSQSYIVALKEWSTEFFYNAGNPIGSPFSPVPNAFTQVGCASGESVATIDKALIWVSQSRKKKGRSVHMMDGMQQAPISTEDVERVLNADDLAEVYAYGVTLDGHPLYVLTLVTSNITLVYDLKSQTWGQWSSLTLGSQVSVSSITRSGTTATVTTGSAHGLSDGDPVKISGASQSDYNGTFQIAYISTTSFSIEVANSPATPATGTILAYPYTETYWKFTHYATGAGRDFLLHKSDGHLYEFDSTLYQDNAIPVNFFMRTARLDGAETRLKKMPRITLIGDKQSDTAMIRWSDDDSATFSAYRRVDLSDAEPMLRRCGSFRRRSLEVRHTGNTAQRFGSLELEVSQ